MAEPGAGPSGPAGPIRRTWPLVRWSPSARPIAVGTAWGAAQELALITVLVTLLVLLERFRPAILRPPARDRDGSGPRS